MAEPEPSRRLVDQRLRNRIMEAVLSLAEGERGVDEAGAAEWFESFFDYFPYEGPHVRDLSSVSDQEWAALTPLVTSMQAACRDTPANISDAELIASGWPAQIAPIAAEALAVYLVRGRFSEHVEEATPSSPTPWP